MTSAPSRSPSPLERALDLLTLALKGAIGLLLAGMVALVFANVVLRYAFNSGISVSEEVSRWMFVWLVFLGAIVGLRERAHLGVDSLVRALPPAGRRLCFVASHALMLFVSVLLVQGSWAQAVINWNVAAPASGLSTGFFYAAGLVFGLAACLLIALELWRALSGRMSAEDYVAVRESEDA